MIPHKHHEGPIDEFLVHRLIKEFKQMMQDLVVIEKDSDTWFYCQLDWLREFWYSVSRLREVQRHLAECKDMDPEYHGKVIDICLSIQSDYWKAKERNFEQGD